MQNGWNKKTASPIFVNPLSHTALVNALKKVTGSAITYGGGSDGNSLGSSTPWCQLYIDPKNFLTPPAKSYPIVAVAYALFYGQNNGVHLADKTTLIKYVVSSAANKLVAKFEYTPLSSSVETAVLNALNGQPSKSQAACLQ